MNIAFIGPGIMPIPPDGWGAVEMMIWDYATVLGELGHTGAIINTPDRSEIIEELKDESYTKNDDFYIFSSTQNDIDTFVSFGADENHCWLSRLGVLPDSYQFDENATYDRTLSFSQICDRKRQYLIQDFDNIDFIGRMEYGKFNNRTNYKGEMLREKLNTEITKYSNFTLLSSVENTTPLVVKEALICGLGVVVSEQVSVELDTSLDFIDVIPEDKIEDLSYIKDILKKNKEYSIKNRNQIREYGIKTFCLPNILEFEYVPKLQSLL